MLQPLARKFPHETWQTPCRLEPALLEQRVLSYNQQEYDFVSAVETIFASSDLGGLDREPILPFALTPPPLRRAQIQARIGAAVCKPERKAARRRSWDFERSAEFKAFVAVYQRFIVEWVAPQLGGGPLIYQRRPILRVVLPGSVAPTALHSDADYYHDSNELNFWVPLTHVGGANSLFSESAPGRGDYAPFVAGPGEAVRFYGNRCRHYTTPNPPAAEGGTTRVSFDFRVIPQRLFEPPPPEVERRSPHSLHPGNAKRGYYAVAQSGGDVPRSADGVLLGAQRRAWRERTSLPQQSSRK